MGVSKTVSERQKIERLGEVNINNQGVPMKIIVYNNHKDIVVEFLDDYKEKVHTSYKCFKEGSVENHYARLGEERLNNQGCLMRIVEYIDAVNIIVEFQDQYKGKVHTQYSNFKRGNVKNPFYPSVYSVGITGNKYPTWIIGTKKHMKEYDAWQNMLARCFDNKIKEKYPTYKDATCCKEWLFYDNFYEWLHLQENFNKWHDNIKWHLDKDILVKGNKLYSPETCSLVPYNVNKLFVKGDSDRGELPIGVTFERRHNGFVARCMNPFIGNRDYLGHRKNVEDAFQLYKTYKENIIKQVAQIEFDKGNITKKCYNAMMQYQVEITD